MGIFENLEQEKICL